MKYMSLDQRGKIMAEYVWIDAHGGVRSKTKVRDLSFTMFLSFVSCRVLRVVGGLHPPALGTLAVWLGPGHFSRTGPAPAPPRQTLISPSCPQPSAISHARASCPCRLSSCVTTRDGRWGWRWLLCSTCGMDDRLLTHRLALDHQQARLIAR